MTASCREGGIQSTNPISVLNSREIGGKMSLLVDLSQRGVVIFGGGDVSERKASTFVQVAKQVLVVGLEFGQNLENMTKIFNNLRLVRANIDSPLIVRKYLHDAFIVIPATSSHELNRKIADQAHSMGKLVNRVDDHIETDIIVPAVIRRGDLQIAISTGGKSPMFSRYLRTKFESLLDEADILLMEVEISSREIAMSRISSRDRRREALSKIIVDQRIHELLGQKRLDEAKAEARKIVEDLAG